MSYVPKFNVIIYTAYNISKFSFYTKSKNDHSTMQNSGFMVGAESMNFYNSKDKNHAIVSR